MVGGMIVGGWRCFKAPEAVAIEAVFESPLNPISLDVALDAELLPASAPSLLRCFPSDLSFSLPSVMAAIPPKFCHRSNSHCGGRRMTKTTDATMSEMPNKAIVGGLAETNGARLKKGKMAVGKVPASKEKETNEREREEKKLV